MYLCAEIAKCLRKEEMACSLKNQTNQSIPMIQTVENDKFLVSTPANQLVAYNPIIINKPSNSNLKRPDFLKIKKYELHLVISNQSEEYNKYKLEKSEIIKINVGGSVFASYKSTFTKKIKKPNSEDYYTANLIEEILDGRLDYNLDDNGGIFFDRNPFYFEFILEVRK
jgi:hypothetical protein